MHAKCRMPAQLAPMLGVDHADGHRVTCPLAADDAVGCYTFWRRRRKAAVLTRFWHVVVQKRRLAFRLVSRKTRPHAASAQMPARWPCPSASTRPRASAQMEVHIATSRAPAAW